MGYSYQSYVMQERRIIPGRISGCEMQKFETAGLRDPAASAILTNRLQLINKICCNVDKIERYITDFVAFKN